MGLFDRIKDIMSIPEEDEFENEPEMEEEAPVSKRVAVEEPAPARRTESPRIFQGGRSKNVSYAAPVKPAIQVVLVKPERFEDVPAIADHLNEGKTVVLNLEAADRENSRRIVDFISGVAYANHGNIRKVANSTFIVVPTEVDIMGELMLDDYGDTSKLYF